MTKEPRRILIVGGGHAGMYTALRLQRKLKQALKRGAVHVTVVNADPYMTYQPFLPEAAAGSVSPRHVVVPLRRILPGCRLVIGEATAVRHAERIVTVRTLASAEDGASPTSIPYDELILAPGSVSRIPPIPGLADHGIRFRTVEEAIGLRNHVLEQLDLASSTRDPEVRAAALTFVVIGGGYAGVEALAELADMARCATRSFRNIRSDDLRWVLAEASHRLLPEAGEELGRHAARELRGRSADIRLGTRLESCANRLIRLSDGSRFRARTLVWTADVQPHPLLATTGLPLTAAGRLRCTPALQVADTQHVWAAGDAAAVPDLAASRKGAVCAPNAQHAVRQARVLADNVLAALHGAPLTEYRHAGTGSVASLGLHSGVAHIHGRRLTGYPAWFMHRTYHLSRVPTLNRRARILAEWTLSGLFKREIVALGSLEKPRTGSGPAAGTGHATEAG